MEREPERDAVEAEAVRRYLEAMAVPSLDREAVEARARRLGRRRVTLLPGAGAVVAAALLVGLASRAYAPPPRPAAIVPAKSVRLGPIHAPAHGTSATAAQLPMAGYAAALTVRPLGVQPITFRGRRYTVEDASPAPSLLGARLFGRPPVRSRWQVPGVVPVPGQAHAFTVLALYALAGRPTKREVAVLGRFGTGPAALWRAVVQTSR